MPQALPANPNLDWLKKTAKQRLVQLRTSQPDAKLHLAQFAVAHDYRLKGEKEPRMTSDNHARLRVAALIFTMVNAVVFGVGLVTVLTTPAMAQHAFFWIPAVVVSSFVISPPLAWFIAPMMMRRFIQARQMR